MSRVAVAPLVLMMFAVWSVGVVPSRHLGVLPSPTEGHHRVRRAEDGRLPEPEGGGQRHPLLPAHRTGSGETTRYMLYTLAGAIHVWLLLHYTWTTLVPSTFSHTHTHLHAFAHRGQTFIFCQSVFPSIHQDYPVVWITSVSTLVFGLSIRAPLIIAHIPPPPSTQGHEVYLRLLHHLP